MDDFLFRRVSIHLRHRTLTAEYTCSSRRPIRIWVESELSQASEPPSSSENCEHAKELIEP
ncbi:hypothetical protein K443DRAFT_676604 [Laccaria amethystina LaAM-08-1]|uniref:Uncharacterized protein n=1 Tax=Laccaria amethystina LaAM-08-1 TaxID=1095629 RepID=A0A0C9Y6D7_9AGAR|nr:hypothetical protein K443DRAFT_676604 [Laccaria amethystina LaAM-08-1]